MRCLIPALLLYSAAVGVEATDYQLPLQEGARPENWSVNFGHWEIEDGQMVCRQLEKDNHAAASRLKVPGHETFSDATIQFDLKLGGAKFFHAGFDPAPGQTKKKGHLFSLVIMPGKVQLLEHKDKADPNSGNQVHATAEGALPPNDWVTVKLELKGDTVQAAVGESLKLRVESSDFGLRKPAVVFRVGGGDAYLRNLSVVIPAGQAAKAEDREPLPPAIVEVKLEPKANAFDNSSVREPLQIKDAETAAKYFDEKRLADLQKQVDFGQQVVLVFAWKGSGQDTLRYAVAESFPEQVVFGYKPGLTRDLRPHVKIYILRSNVKWKVVG